MPRNASAETPEERRARHLREIADYEAEHDIVPGTSTYREKTGPAGGQEWEGCARMALARREAGIDLTERDLEALRRYPNPRSSFTGLPLLSDAGEVPDVA